MFCGRFGVSAQVAIRRELLPLLPGQRVTHRRNQRSRVFLSLPVLSSGLFFVVAQRSVKGWVVPTLQACFLVFFFRALSSGECDLPVFFLRGPLITPCSLISCDWECKRRRAHSNRMIAATTNKRPRSSRNSRPGERGGPGRGKCRVPRLSRGCFGGRRW